MTLPFEGPIAPMLARLQDDIPVGDGWMYEPKWDGFRALVFKDGTETTIFSRDLRPFNRYFPELIAAFAEALPKTCVVDGEIVIPGTSSLDFDSMLLRIHPAESRVRMLAEQTPSSFVAFDLLAHASTDLRDKPLSARRARLDKILGDRSITPNASRTAVMKALKPAPKIVLSPCTDDPKVAKRWFEVYEGAGLDGVVAKKADIRYVPGKREMVKVKHKRTADCVVGGYRLSKTGDGVGSLLLGLYDDAGSLHYVGHTSAFKTAERKALLKELRELEGGVSFEGGRTPGGPSRWTGARNISWVSLGPELVCEVTFDHLQGPRFRHAAGFVRWRPEKKPSECTFDQVL